MEKILSKIVRLFMILLLAVSGVLSAPTEVSAQNHEASEIVDLGTYEYYNPRYYPEAEQLTPAESRIDENVSEIQATSMIPSWTVGYIRNEFKQRHTSISITLPYQSGITSIYRDMFVNAVETHTGIPDEGDYLAWQYGSMQCHITSDYQTVTFDYTIVYYTTRAQEDQVTKAVNNLKKELAVDNRTNFQIIATVYEWIADNVTYSEDLNPIIIHTAYAAIINRDAVCQGYAVLFYRMMLEYGIDCRVITSYDHAWNIVKLGNKYYEIDNTWASTTGDYDEYFLRGFDHFPDHEEEYPYYTEEFKKKYPIDPEDYVPSDGDLEDRECFSDVRDPNAYYFAPVYWAVDNNITLGYGGNNKFSPNVPCTREQIVTFLWRLKGEPEPTEYQEFTDVKETDWYYKPISWAAENGITLGLNDGTGRFGVGQPCTREQCVTFLYRTAGSPEVEEHSEFTDVTEDRYFYDSVSWAAVNGITVGLNDGTGRFGVSQKCTRAMIVTFLYRYAMLDEEPVIDEPVDEGVK